MRHEKEFTARLEHMHLNPVRKGLMKRPENWRWSNYDNFALDRNAAGRCPIQIDYVRLPDGYRELLRKLRATRTGLSRAAAKRLR